MTSTLSLPVFASMKHFLRQTIFPATSKKTWPQSVPVVFSYKKGERYTQKKVFNVIL